MAKEKSYKKEYDNTLKQLKALKNKYDIQKAYSDKIENRLKILEKKIQTLRDDRKKQKEKTHKEILKDKEIQARDILIKQMQFELKKQMDLTNLYNSHIQKEQEYDTLRVTNRIPVIIIDNFTKEDIATAHKEFGLKDQVVFFKNFKYSIQALTSLINFRPKAILNHEKKHESMLNKHSIISKDVTPQMHNFYGSITEKEL